MLFFLSGRISAASSLFLLLLIFVVVAATDFNTELAVIIGAPLLLFL